MRNIFNTRRPTAPAMALFSLMLLGLLAFVAACGNSSTTTGSASTPTTAAATSAATDTSGNGGTTGYGGGRYGGGGGGTPTATKAVTGPTQNASITLDNTGTFTFSPSSLTIKVGTTVVWKNSTQTPHTVTSDDDTTFNSGDSTPIGPGATFSFTFTKAGTFAYHCDFHPYMKATIVVQ